VKPKPPVREKTTQIGLRVPDSLLQRIDQHAERLRAETRLPAVSRTDAALALIAVGLDVAEAANRSRPQRRS
jgi:hypothetical protein